MRQHRITIAVLLVGLILSNGWWASRLFDAGLTHTYAQASMGTTAEAFAQTLAILPVVARPGATRNDVVIAARVPGDPVEPFEKEGRVWVGRLGLRFDEQGRFIDAVAGEGGEGGGTK